MNQTNPIIVINANMGSKGHQIGRLIASCSNVKWYDHEWNGSNPWEPCKHILNHEHSIFHFDRRFSDDTTLPPVLDFAERSNHVDQKIPYEQLDKNQNFLYITHSKLDEARSYFNGKHLVVFDKDIKRFFDTSWKFKVGKTKTPISELYTVKQAKAMLKGVLDSYTTHVSNEDFTIRSVDDLLHKDMFKMLCSKFKLNFNEIEYNKVCKFINDSNTNNG